MAEELPTQGPVFLIEVDKIRPNPHQPRKNFDEEALRELANSIRDFGILQPLVVSKVEEFSETGTTIQYELIAGERRWLASKLLGLERVPALIRSIKLDRERLELAVIENVQRANLNAIEAARAYAKLQDQFNLTQREIASRIGKSREVIANSVRLLNLPTNIQEAVGIGKLSESQARLLLAIPDIAEQQMLFEDILRNNLSVREVRTKVERSKARELEKANTLFPTIPDIELESLTHALEEFLGARVNLEKKGPSGKIVIDFYSQEELKGIIAKLVGVNRNIAETELPAEIPEEKIENESGPSNTIFL